MKRTVLMIFAFAVFFSFVVLAVQFNSLKLPALILGGVPFCVAGMIYMLYATALPGATVLIGLLVVVASTVNEGVLLLTFAEELRLKDGLAPFGAVLNAAKIRLRPRVMISLSIIVGFIPLALNLEEGGDMLQPMAAAAIGGLSLGAVVALFLMPCLYIIFARKAERAEKLSSAQAWRVRKKSRNRQAGLDPASRTHSTHWIPAVNDMSYRTKIFLAVLAIVIPPVTTPP
jgi:hydrophobic/amphiphilic exporter-1 (mainly G- bacteria), HAE1 family